MVDRCKIEEEATPCTVVDLDGTYVAGNTLKIYLKCGVRYLIENNKYRELATLLIGVGKRKLRLVSHKEMKSVILDVLSKYDGILEDFSERVAGKVNPSVSALIAKRMRQGERVLLATAAPSCYVGSIWEGDFVATEYEEGSEMVECRGNEKLNRVSRWLADNNCRLDTVITDHKDDAPLLEANVDGTNLLVNPSESTLEFLRKVPGLTFMDIEDYIDR